MTHLARGLTLAAMLGAAGLAAGCGPRVGPAHHRVAIRGLAFAPDTLRVAPGDTVTWINDDIVPHTVTGVGNRLESGELGPGGRYDWVVVAGGTREYECRYHPTMIGRLMVER